MIWNILVQSKYMRTKSCLNDVCISAHASVHLCCSGFWSSVGGHVWGTRQEIYVTFIIS